MSNSPLEFKAAGRTDRDRSFGREQDALLIRPDLGLVVVAHGTAGRSARTAAQMATAAIETFFDVLASLWLTDSRGAPVGAEAQLGIAVERASATIHAASGHVPGQRGLRATVAAALVRDTSLYLALVGDCRVHRLRAGQLEQLAVEYTTPAGRTAQYALGHVLPVERIASRETMLAGDVVLLTTAGVHEVVEPAELRDLLRNVTDLDSGVDALLARARTRRGSGDRTAILVRWST